MPRWARIDCPDYFPAAPGSTSQAQRATASPMTSRSWGYRRRSVSDFADLVGRVVGAIDPLDDLEADDQAACLAWIASGAPLCRTQKPATPPQHLVAYAVAVDPTRRQLLLVDHRQAELWLPTGGHVEPGEHPATAARRELSEELNIDADPLAGADAPVMVRLTTAAGRTVCHVDVSLWYAFHVDTDAELRPDPGEFADVRWWPFAEVSATAERIGPNIGRFLAKADALITAA
jgi:8-oxo-dGTP diphosphatase